MDRSSIRQNGFDCQNASDNMAGISFGIANSFDIHWNHLIASLYARDRATDVGIIEGLYIANFTTDCDRDVCCAGAEQWSLDVDVTRVIDGGWWDLTQGWGDGFWYVEGAISRTNGIDVVDCDGDVV